MGYTTQFNGSFKLNKELDDDLYTFLKEYCQERHNIFEVVNSTNKIRRNDLIERDDEFITYSNSECHSVKGEFKRSDRDVDYNDLSHYCQWQPTDDKKGIEWDGGEKFYNYINWLKYLIKTFLDPNGYVLNGCVVWVGEEPTDVGCIICKNNIIQCYELTPDFCQYLIDKLNNKTENINGSNGI